MHNDKTSLYSFKNLEQSVPTIKMQKNHICAIIIATTTFIFWLYRSFGVVENQNTPSFKLLRPKYQYLKNYYQLEPLQTTCTQSPHLLIIVTSYVGHVELRSAHRRAMPAELLQSMNATRVFLLARIPPRETSITQEAVKNENDIYGDILQGTFEEHYRNLTHKHLMGLQWAATTCANATFLLKVDDDTVFRLDKTYDLLSTLNDTDKNNLLIGYKFNTTTPKRLKENKWYVSWEEYDRDYYPVYVSGWYYITTPKVAARLTKEAAYHPFFWIDDVFITGILTEALRIKLSNVPHGFWMAYYEIVECCLKHMIENNIKCDYAVGPNGNRFNLIVEFNKALEECDGRQQCKVKHEDEPLCVSERDRAIFSEGVGEFKILNKK